MYNAKTIKLCMLQVKSADFVRKTTEFVCNALINDEKHCITPVFTCLVIFITVTSCERWDSYRRFIDYLFISLYRLTSKKPPELRITGHFYDRVDFHDTTPSCHITR